MYVDIYIKHLLSHKKIHYVHVDFEKFTQRQFVKTELFVRSIESVSLFSKKLSRTFSLNTFNTPPPRNDTGPEKEKEEKGEKAVKGKVGIKEAGPKGKEKEKEEKVEKEEREEKEPQTKKLPNLDLRELVFRYVHSSSAVRFFFSQ